MGGERGLRTWDLKSSGVCVGQVPTPFGSVAIKEFDLEDARKLDVVFLAVGGDFSKDYAHKIGEGVSCLRGASVPLTS